MARHRSERLADVSVSIGAPFTALVTLAFLASPIAVVLLLNQRLGWAPALLLGWVAGPVAAVAGAALMLIWTIPFRHADTLSLRPPNREAAPDLVQDATYRPLTINVVMPVYNAAHYLVRSLPPLLEMVRRGELHEVVVVDDCSSDNSADFARSLGATVLLSPKNGGPAQARNLGVEQTQSDILWFVDADVVVHPEAVGRVQAAFRDPEVVAVFGSYDDRPDGKNFGAQYKNLVHHHYHQNANPAASTFWTGCGATRRQALMEVGGFDAEAFTIPAMEDVDLGYRLRRKGGEIRLDRLMLGTHLKNWTVVELVRTDIFQRALPWSRLMLRQKDVLDDLNVGTFERVRAVYAGVTVLVIAASVAGLLSIGWLLPTLATALTGNWHLFRLFQRRRGVAFAAAGLAFHQVYYLYSSAAFVWCWLEVKFGKPTEGLNPVTDTSA